MVKNLQSKYEIIFVCCIIQVTSAVFNQSDENLSDSEDQRGMNSQEERSDENELDENEDSTTKVYLQLI